MYDHQDILRRNAWDNPGVEFIDGFSGQNKYIRHENTDIVSYYEREYFDGDGKYGDEWMLVYEYQFVDNKWVSKWYDNYQW